MTLFSKNNAMWDMSSSSLILKNVHWLCNFCFVWNPESTPLTVYDHSAETAKQRPDIISKFLSITQSSSPLHITTAFCNIIRSLLRKYSASSGRAQTCETRTLHASAMLMTGSLLSSLSKSTSTCLRCSLVALQNLVYTQEMCLATIEVYISSNNLHPFLHIVPSTFLLSPKSDSILWNGFVCSVCSAPKETFGSSYVWFRLLSIFTLFIFHLPKIKEAWSMWLLFCF
jgi:hypothetical protein